MGEVEENTQEALGWVRERFERCVGAGQAVFEPGEPARELYVVQQGEVEILRPVAGGTRKVDHVRPGEFFGEMSVVLGGRRSVRAVAVTDARLLEIDRETFHAMCLERPEIALRVIERLTVRVLHLEERLGTLAVTELVRPVAEHLLAVAEPDGAEHRIETDLRAIAAGAGLSMLDAHRAVQELLDRRLLRLEHDVLRIPEPDALARHPTAAD